MRNIALVHLELNLFISRKSGVRQALLLRNVDKFRTYPSPFSCGSMAVFETYYSSKRIWANNSICKCFMLLRTIKVVHLDAWRNRLVKDALMRFWTEPCSVMRLADVIQRWFIWTYNASFCQATDKARFKWYRVIIRKEVRLHRPHLSTLKIFLESEPHFVCGNPFAPGISMFYDSAFLELMHTKLKTLNVY